MGRVYKGAFVDAGYRAPTAFINIAGRPLLFWLIDNLSMTAHDQLYIVIPKEFNLGYAVDRRLHEEFPDRDILVIELQFSSRGPLETLMIGTHGVEEHRQNCKTLSLDCDTIYFGDILQAFREVDASRGVSFYSDLQTQESSRQVSLFLFA
jgi:choline kinase